MAEGQDWPDGWKGALLAVGYLVYVVVGGAIVYYVLFQAQGGYGWLLVVGALVGWLVWKKWLGREWLAYLLGFYGVVAILVVTNTVGLGVAAGFIALVLYGVVSNERSGQTHILQTIRESIAILADRPMPSHGGSGRRTPDLAFCAGCGYEYSGLALARRSAACPQCGANRITSIRPTA